MDSRLSLVYTNKQKGFNMQIIKVNTPEDGGNEGVRIISNALKNNRLNCLGLATGSTPITLYQAIIAQHINMQHVVSVNLDEYVGLSAKHPQSYHQFMQKKLFDKVNFTANYLPNGDATVIDDEIKRYNDIIAKNPIDIQILGIGENGHIGFNEPGTSFDSETHLVDLTANTIKANARFFENIADVPTQAITMGIQQIMAAKQIIMLAYGTKKAQAIANMIKGPIVENMPASILQKHKNVIVIADGAALSLL